MLFRHSGAGRNPGYPAVLNPGLRRGDWVESLFRDRLFFSSFLSSVYPFPPRRVTDFQLSLRAL